MAVDIEKIMRELREEIEQMGEEEKVLSFEDMPLEKGTAASDKAEFDYEELWACLNAMNVSHLIYGYRPFTGNPIKTLIKKVIRKLTSFYVEPIVRDQTMFNYYTVRVSNQVRNYVNESLEKQEEIEQLKERIALLEQKLEALIAKDQ